MGGGSKIIQKVFSTVNYTCLQQLSKTLEHACENIEQFLKKKVCLEFYDFPECDRVLCGMINKIF
jgi:hypothetical protein